MEPTAAAQTAAATTSGANRSPIGQLDADAFLQMFIAQVRNQDPMEPMDQSAMLEQTAQLTQVQTFETIRAQQETLLRWNQFSLASSMLGETVNYTDQTDQTVTGVVSSIDVSSGDVTLTIDGAQVPIDQVTGIIN